MNKFLLRSLFLLGGLLIFVTCKKDEEPGPDTDDPGANPGQFSWKPGQGASVTADSAYYYPQFTTIYAFKNGSANMIEVNLSALSAGSYTLSSSSGNALTFVTNGTSHNAVSGSLNISAAGNNKLSGSFSASLSGGTITAITGSFTDIPRR